MIPERFGPFLLSERLHGLAGEAYRARRVVTPGQLSGPVLVEVYRAAPEGLSAALTRAGEWGARVAHPGVVRVLEVGTLEGTLYSVSELAEGVDLGAVLTAASGGEGAPSVPTALAIGAQLARVAREVHEQGGGREQLGLFRPGDVTLGYDGRVRVRAKGVIERPRPGEGRDPFLAPELARSAPLAPTADVWTLTRVLRAVLAADPLGKRTPKVSARYKDSLGSLLTEALARDPSARLSMEGLERRLLDLALEENDDLSAPVVALLQQHAGGALPVDDDALGFAEAEALSAGRASSRVVLFPLAAAGKGTRTGSFARPRVDVPLEDDGSLEAVTAAGDDVRLGSAAELLGFEEDGDGGLDLDAIARASLNGQAALADPLAGTAIIARPRTLAPAPHDEGDVFQTPAPARAPSKKRPAADAAPLRTPAPPAAGSHEEGGDVFTASLRSSEVLAGFASSPATKIMRSRAKSAPSLTPSRIAAEPAVDPDKTAFFENPAGLFESAADTAAVRPLTPMPIAADDDDQPTERVSADLVQEAVRLARAASAAEAAGASLERSVEPSMEDGSADPSVLEDELGRLVIDVSDSAVVFVNGEQRGQGRTTLEGLDRFARFVVRIHQRGHLPWTGTVSLKGMPAARIEPELTPRR